MKDLNIIDNFMDEREFRNYIGSLLVKLGFTDISLEDARLSDEDDINNNDIFAKKDGIRYTIQTFLNKEISEKQIKETADDMKTEHVSVALIVTNTKTGDDIKEEAKKECIEIIDRDDLERYIGDSNE